jgi:hypothetical protein
MDHYFISYTWTTSDGRQLVENKLINRHPLAWLKEWVTMYPHERYRLVSWQPISARDYKAYNDFIG